MNYRHIYHAGNFADVVKHVVLVVLLQALQRKDTPLCFLDTHAGIGLYSLQSIQTQKTREYLNGIAKLFFENKHSMPHPIQRYVEIVENYNANNTLIYYPGSPVIAADLLRPQDQIIACELHPNDCQTLREHGFERTSIAIHHMDAYSGIKVFIPPKQKRGLVLIDPPFEAIDEFERIQHTLQHALQHWRSGHFMVWYPIKNHAALKNFYRDIAKNKTSYLMIHFSVSAEHRFEALSECGILLINPPWQTKELLAHTVLPYLADTLNARWKIIAS